ncbi:hypothetical protein ACU21_09125 [Actinobaculum suis]|uniref:IS21-like element helper ATPase IstB n=1 Tax=Actinobaculum suis TaxID=1657 RepID=UPI0008086B33|nr:IS21-like element helper ATPase IstB [Actinobaculum suis]OCA93703.1 hypothetical protein ACU21_09125 [Actinobaculum suis]
MTPSSIQTPNIDQITNQLRTLHMPHARRQIHDILATATSQRWDPTAILTTVLETEIQGRARTSLERRLKQLGLPATKTFDTFDPTLSTIPAHTLSFLEGLEWIDRKENLVLAGPAGTGKSHLAAALAQKTVQHGGNAAWLTLPDLERLVASHRVDYTIEKTMNKLARNNLIIIDDIGLLPITQTAAEGFYRICDAAYERTSLLITTNQHPSHFDKIMPTSLATAAVDRLLHHAHIHITSGDSIRLTHSLTNTTKQA